MDINEIRKRLSISKSEGKNITNLYGILEYESKNSAMVDNDSIEVIISILSGEENTIKKYPNHNCFLVIDILKNNPDQLDYYLELRIKNDLFIPIPKLSFFCNIKSNKTFDVCKKYNLKNSNLRYDDVTDEQWDYLREINFIDDEIYYGSIYGYGEAKYTKCGTRISQYDYYNYIDHNVDKYDKEGNLLPKYK